MAERYRFSVEYEPATMKSAVRAYLWRGLTYENTWISTAAVTVLTVGAVVVIFAHDYDFMTGLFAGLIAALAVSIVLAGWLHWRGMQAKLARMKEPRALFVLSDEAVEVKTDQGSGRFPWDTIRQIWKFKRVWLLMMDLNRFVTLPLAGASAEALQFLDEKIRPRSFRD